VVSCQLSVLSKNTAPLLSPPCRVIPSVARNRTLFCGGGKNQSEIPRFAQSKVTSFPRKRESGSFGDVDPRLRGGDEGLIFISMGGPQAQGHSGRRRLY
jgi:hypothetical protein